ncbi:MAG: urea transporter [Leptonema sp. (in: Bacteria)]|nr:urea transporter [Leptonema sp. (in: bacteria)]
MPAETKIFLPVETAATLIFIFSAFWIWLGWWVGRKTKSVEDHMLAGRNVGLALATATAMATWVTANTTMVAPQFAYEFGILGVVGYSLGAVGLILFAPVSERIRTMLPDGCTSGDFMRMRFGNTAWRIFLAFSLVYAMGWLVSLSMAGGILIQALSGIEYRIGMTVILVVCTTYTLLGGLRAVIATDFLQSLIILIGIAYLGYRISTGSIIDRAHEVIVIDRPQLLNLLLPAAVMFLFNNLIFGVGEIFHSNVWWSRAFAFRKGVGFKAYLFSGLFWIPVPIVAGYLAFVAPALGVNVPRSDMVGPLAAAYLVGEVGAVLIFIVIFSALASSMDSLLAATSDLLTEDVYRRHFKPQATPEERLKATRYILLTLSFVVWLLCLPDLERLGQILNFAGPFVASMIWPILGGLYFKRTNSVGVSLSMLLGSGAGLYAYFAIGFYVSALAGAAVSLVVLLITSLIFPGNFQESKP